MLMWKVKERLEHYGVPVAWGEGERYLEVEIPEHVLVTVEPRPLYCDRGNYIVKVFPRGDLAVDGQDMFPRYYFGVEACASEIWMWLRVRQILPEA